ncbi:MAG: flagellar type III secretion system pore protein FliP [Alphaproteobacteria bacterium]|nr:flagellar type III secretion system pore protein FliP [Alphaproteobacteria bacterium]
MKRLIIPIFLSVFVALFCFLPTAAWAQQLNLDLGQGPTTSSRLIQITLLITVITLAPSILMMVTCFTRVVVVLSFLRTAIGVQQTPPNIVLISLALFLTFFIMQPSFEKAWEEGMKPLMNNEIDEETAFGRTVDPFADFMYKHTREKDLALFMGMAKIAPAETKDKASEAKPEKVTPPLRALVPAFMISELRRSFEIGFLVFLPFLIIDMVIASLLMSMGMMMLPPTVISMPFKIIFFVLVDGWYLIAGSLVQSYGGG